MDMPYFLKHDKKEKKYEINHNNSDYIANAMRYLELKQQNNEKKKKQESDYLDVNLENFESPKYSEKKNLMRSCVANSNSDYKSPTSSTTKQINYALQELTIPNFEPTKYSEKKNGLVKAYAANTNQGLVRNYNEDRVSIILNIMKPKNKSDLEKWPKCSFFGIYDGHGGVTTADFLRDHLHQFVIKDLNFPWNPKEALRNGFQAAESQIIEAAQSNNNGNAPLDRSGSCAIVVLIVEDMCYVANVGDSRAVMSGDGGTKVYPLSRDHKPLDEIEHKRILEGGGKIYQTKIQAPSHYTNDSKDDEEVNYLLGPYRVTRAFGDIEAKTPKYGGNPNVVIAQPEIRAFKITDNHDFIILACDGIFDKMTSREVIQAVWENARKEKGKNIHEQSAKGVEIIMKDSLNRKTVDNITVVMVSFKNYKKKIFGSKNKPIKEKDEDLKKLKENLEEEKKSLCENLNKNYKKEEKKIEISKDLQRSYASYQELWNKKFKKELEENRKYKENHKDEEKKKHESKEKKGLNTKEFQTSYSNYQETMDKYYKSLSFANAKSFREQVNSAGKAERFLNLKQKAEPYTKSSYLLKNNNESILSTRSAQSKRLMFKKF